MKYVNISSPILYKDRFEFDERYVEKADELFRLVTKYSVDTPVERGGSSTANLYGIKEHRLPHTDPLFNPFLYWLDEKLAYLKKVWKYENSFPHFISNSWFNEHFRGDWTDEHAHGPCIVCTAYVRKPEDSGNLLVRDPLTEVRTSEPMDIQPWRLIPVEQGDVVFFPGWLRHKTEPSQSDTRRLTLTLNITPNYECGTF
jgi:hypothetical protein